MGRPTIKGRSGIERSLQPGSRVGLSAQGNFSGGAPYGIELPDRGSDPIFVNEEHGLPFVDYLRLTFRWGGFPRLQCHAHNIDVHKFVAEMTKDMEPF
jgi:hypothetical protein